MFPISTGGDYDFRQPTSIVHVGKYLSCSQTQTMAKFAVDYTKHSANEAVEQILKLNPDEYNHITAVK